MNNQESFNVKTDNIFNSETDIESELLSTLTEERKNQSLFIEKIKNFLINRESQIAALAIAFFYIALIVKIVINLLTLTKSILSLNTDNISLNIVDYLFWGIAPIIVWIISTHTKINEWRFTNRKIGSLFLFITNITILLGNVIFVSSCYFFIPIIMHIPVSNFISPAMIVSLCRLIIAAICIVSMIIIEHFCILLVLREEVKNLILHFKFNRHLDLRNPFLKRFQYDISVFKRLKNGKLYSIKESMRKYHMMIIGATGSGKTATGFLPGIANDLDQRIYNLNYQKNIVLKYLKKGKVKLIENITDDDFSLNKFKGINKWYDRKLKALSKKAQLCGMTIIAPNADFADQVYELLKNRGLEKNINRIDPELDEYGKIKPGYRGLNPLFIRKNIPHDRRMLEIIHKSRTFSDVMQSLFEEGGSKNIYFSSLNRQFTSSVCTILMVTMPRLHKKDPQKYPKYYVTPEDFYNVMNNFELMSDYCNEMENYLSDYPEDERFYRNILILIQRDMLGEGRKALQEQARGLVIQISDLLANPSIRNLLCCEDSVDFDDALSESQITLINYSLAMGDSDSRALGLFSFLLLQNAMFRRSKKKRPIHFVFIDEFPELLHPKFSKAFSIYRQYNGCLHIALQSLSQFAAKKETEFLKNVLLANASTQILFGRGGIEEMEIYEKLAGKINKLSVQHTTSQSALSLDDPSLSFSDRSQLVKENYMEGSDFRNKDFLEATILTLDEGNPVDMFSAVFNFLTPKQKSGKKIIQFDWSPYYQQDTSTNSDGILKTTAKIFVNNTNENSVSNDIIDIEAFVNSKTSKDDNKVDAEADIVENDENSEKKDNDSVVFPEFDNIAEILNNFKKNNQA